MSLEKNLSRLEKLYVNTPELKQKFYDLWHNNGQVPTPAIMAAWPDADWTSDEIIALATKLYGYESPRKLSPKMSMDTSALHAEILQLRQDVNWLNGIITNLKKEKALDEGHYSWSEIASNERVAARYAKYLNSR